MSNTSSEFLNFARLPECDTVSFPINGKTEVLHHLGQAVFVSKIYNTINIVRTFVTDNFWYEIDGEAYVKRMLFSITKLRVFSLLPISNELTAIFKGIPVFSLMVVASSLVFLPKGQNIVT
jgi:hypothetical protein